MTAAAAAAVVDRHEHGYRHTALFSLACPAVQVLNVKEQSATETMLRSKWTRLLPTAAKILCATPRSRCASKQNEKATDAIRMPKRDIRKGSLGSYHVRDYFSLAYTHHRMTGYVSS